MTRISIILGLTKEQYQDLYLEEYLRWCMSWSTYPYGSNESAVKRNQREIMETSNDLQKLFGNSAISKWYRMEYENRERLFFEDFIEMNKRKANAAVFIPLSHQEVRAMYDNYVRDISTYPKPLFEAARKIRIVNDHTAN